VSGILVAIIEFREAYKIYIMVGQAPTPPPPLTPDPLMKSQNMKSIQQENYHLPSFDVGEIKIETYVLYSPLTAFVEISSIRASVLSVSSSACRHFLE
jgi:hypothetical protein